MINKILKLLILKSEQGQCAFCKKPIIYKIYRQKLKSLPVIKVRDGDYCSRKCEKFWNLAVKKAFKHKPLNNLEKEALKNTYYMDISA